MDYKEKIIDILTRKELTPKQQQQLETIFPELAESEEKPNGGIVLEDFNESDGFYRVNLAYLSKEQVEEIEKLVRRWNPELAESEDEKIHKLVIKIVNWYHVSHPYFTEIPKEKVVAWLKKQGGQKSFQSEEVGVAESPSKTFPRVNQFEVGSNYRR